MGGLSRQKQKNKHVIGYLSGHYWHNEGWNEQLIMPLSFPCFLRFLPMASTMACLQVVIADGSLEAGRCENGNAHPYSVENKDYFCFIIFCCPFLDAFVKFAIKTISTSYVVGCPSA